MKLLNLHSLTFFLRHIWWWLYSHHYWKLCDQNMEWRMVQSYFSIHHLMSI